MIRQSAFAPVSSELDALARAICMENNKVNTPKALQKHPLAVDGAGANTIKFLAHLTDRPVEALDFVFFSAAQGAPPHTDDLLTSKFHDTTWLIPLILPAKGAVFGVGDATVALELYGIYAFDHTQTHWLEVGDTETGCTLLMVAEKRVW